MNGAVSNYFPYVHSSFGLVLKSPTKHKIDKSCTIGFGEKGLGSTHLGIAPLWHKAPILNQQMLHQCSTLTSASSPSWTKPKCLQCHCFHHTAEKAGEMHYVSGMWRKAEAEDQISAASHLPHAAAQCHSLQGQQGQGNPMTKPTE